MQQQDRHSVYDCAHICAQIHHKLPPPFNTSTGD